MGKSFSQRPNFNQGPTWLDVHAAMEAVETDLGLHCKMELYALEDRTIHVKVLIYRKLGEERIGIARSERNWPIVDYKHLEGAALMAIHQAYNVAHDLTFNPACRNGKRPR